MAKSLVTAIGFSLLTVIVAREKGVPRKQLRRNLAKEAKTKTNKRKNVKPAKDVTYEPGCFDWGYYIRE